MLNRELHQYNMSLSLHAKLIGMATDRSHRVDGTGQEFVDVQKLLLCLSGVLAEALLDFDNPILELECFGDTLKQHGFGADLPQETEKHGNLDAWMPEVSLMDLDRKLELGRSLARLYLDDEDDSAYFLRDSVANLLETSLGMWADDPVTTSMQLSFFLHATHMALSFEMLAHQFCDRIIDLKIGEEKWSIGDCLMAMGGLAGRYYAFAKLQEDEKDSEAFFNEALNGTMDKNVFMASYPASQAFGGVNDNDQFQFANNIIDVMVSEALRMGVPEGAGVFYGLAANDMEHKTSPHLVYSLEPAFAVLAEQFGLSEYAVRAIAVSKSAGRMIAVASSGTEPEMEHTVARPLALSSFMGSIHHFSPRH